MIKEVADFVKNITNVVNALGINLKATNDGLQLDVIGNTINANIRDGKVRSIKVDMNGNLEEVIDRVANAFEKLDYSDVGREQDKFLTMLDNIPTSADVNPNQVIGVSHYGYPYLFGGGVSAGVLITDREKANDFFSQNDWTQYSPDDKLFAIVKDLIGVGAPTLNELFNGGTKDGESHININTDWCKIRIVNQLPDILNRENGLLAVHPDKNIVYPLMEDVSQKVGVIVGADQWLSDGMIGAMYLSILNDINAGLKFASFEIRRNPVTKSSCSELKLADTITRVAYSTQLAYLINEHQCNLIEGYPNEHSVRRAFDTQFSNLDYDTKTKLLKLYLVTWDKED